MRYLFDEYSYFADSGVSKEDARFLLPYSYKSNFYCTVNARELCNILYSMLYGRVRFNTEIRSLGKALLTQAEKACPYIFGELTLTEEGREDKFSQISRMVPPGEYGGSAGGEPVELISHTPEPDKLVVYSALLSCADCSAKKINELIESNSAEIIDIILSNRRMRELEQINFTFRINGLSLAAVTHIGRHRMQSILIPPFEDICKSGRYVIPESVKRSGALLDRYNTAYSKTKELKAYLAANGVNKHELVYLCLSGNSIDITTTMNARELHVFTGLRACYRSQWEIRDISVEMLRLLRQVSPMVFNRYGPRCYINGKCPEGGMSCGKAKEVKPFFDGTLPGRQPPRH
jgi:thymidylate synthase (FAD)